MPADEIAGGLLRLLLVAFRFFVGIFVDGFLDCVCEWVGCKVLRLVSAGHYPPIERTRWQRVFCIAVGFLVVVAGFTAIAALLWLAVQALRQA